MDLAEEAKNSRGGRTPRFFLDPDYPLDGPESPRLAPEDWHHARHVQRVQTGDRILGLDGCGAAWPMTVVDLARKQVLLEPAGPPERQPAAGEPGSPLAQLHVALSWPRPAKWEGLIDGLTQLGVARLQPVICQYSPPHAREWTSKRAQKAARTVRESMKQCGRLWPMGIDAPIDWETWCSGGEQATTLVMHPGFPPLAEVRPGGAPLRLAIGPEGGFTEAEVKGMAGFSWPGHILRTETAALLGSALLLQMVPGA